MSTGRSRRRVIEDGTRFVVVTGLSGSGKSEALHALEDVDYFAVDNLPTRLIGTFAELAAQGGGALERVAVVADLRDPEFVERFPAALEALRAQSELGAVVLFLEASDAVLVRRFSETRRPHPLAGEQTPRQGIEDERGRLLPIRALADRIIDTTELTVHQLRHLVTDLSPAGAASRLVVTVMSFGFKRGVPLEADLVLDVRFLPNPHFVPALKPLTGRDEGVRAFVEEAEATQTFLEKTTDLLRFLLPQYAAEGKRYLTVAVGCTGGRHRSVVVAEELRRRLTRTPKVRLRVAHRDVELD